MNRIGLRWIRSAGYCILLAPTLLALSGCSDQPASAEGEAYWWLDDERFAPLADSINVEATLALDSRDMVVLRGGSASGEEASRIAVNDFGRHQAHNMYHHPKAFDEFIEEYREAMYSLDQDRLKALVEESNNEPECPCHANCEYPPCENTCGSDGYKEEATPLGP